MAFNKIKEYLVNPSVLMPLRENHPLHIYLSVSKGSIGCVSKKNEEEIYNLSRTLKEIETRYSPIKKVCLALYFACTKLKHYMIGNIVFVVSKDDVIKYMLTRLIIT